MSLRHENLKKKSAWRAEILKNEVLMIQKRRRNNLKETLWVVMGSSLLRPNLATGYIKGEREES